MKIGLRTSAHFRTAAYRPKRSTDGSASIARALAASHEPPDRSPCAAGRVRIAATASRALLIAPSCGAQGGGDITRNGGSRLPVGRVILEYGYGGETGRRPAIELAPAAERGEHWLPGRRGDHCRRWPACGPARAVPGSARLGHPGRTARAASGADRRGSRPHRSAANLAADHHQHRHRAALVAIACSPNRLVRPLPRPATARARI
jgi:hypothetical protein